MTGAAWKKEPGAPPLWDRCDYCGGGIALGEDYYEYDGQRICLCCARRYAWVDFLLRSTRKTARMRGPL